MAEDTRPKLAEFLVDVRIGKPCAVCALPPDILAELNTYFTSKEVNRAWAQTRRWLEACGFDISVHVLARHVEKGHHRG